MSRQSPWALPWCSSNAFSFPFEGCAEDYAVTAINDIGWRALVRVTDGAAVRGFRVTVGGGMATPRFKVETQEGECMA